MVGYSRTGTVGRAGWQNRIGQSAVPEGKAEYGKVQYGIVGYCMYSKVQCRLVAGWWSVGGRSGGDWLDVGWGLVEDCPGSVLYWPM